MAGRVSAAGARGRAAAAAAAAGGSRAARGVRLAAPAARANEAWGRESLEAAWANLRGEVESGKPAQIEGIRSNRDAEARGDRRTASRGRKQANAWTKEDSLDAWAKLREEAYSGKGAKIGGIRSNADAASMGRLGPGNGRIKEAASSKARPGKARPRGTQINRAESRPAGPGPLAGIKRAFEVLLPADD